MRKGIISIVIGLCLAFAQAGWAKEASSKSLGMERMEPGNTYEQKRVSVKHKKYARKSKRGAKNVHTKGRTRSSNIQRETGYQEDGMSGPASRKTNYGGKINTENLPMNEVFPDHR